MYIPVVLTEQYRVIQKGKQYEDIEEAKTAARTMPLERGQMPAVLDECKVVLWKGGIKVTAWHEKMLSEKV